MFSFLTRQIPRTKTASHNPIHFDGGRSSIEFKSSNDRYLVTNRWPPASSPENTNIALRPPLHWHRRQNEMFHILRGTAKFTCGGREVTRGAGESITIPAREIHTFCNGSASEELIVEFVLEPKWSERDEAFFRGNVQSYRDDCRKARMPRSLPQLLLFNWMGDVVMALPGPSILSKPLGMLLNFLGGFVVGKWILGYKESYPEYCKYKV